MNMHIFYEYIWKSVYWIMEMETIKQQTGVTYGCRSKFVSDSFGCGLGCMLALCVTHRSFTPPQKCSVVSVEVLSVSVVDLCSAESWSISTECTVHSVHNNLQKFRKVLTYHCQNQMLDHGSDLVVSSAKFNRHLKNPMLGQQAELKTPNNSLCTFNEMLTFCALLSVPNENSCLGCCTTRTLSFVVHIWCRSETFLCAIYNWNL